MRKCITLLIVLSLGFSLLFAAGGKESTSSDVKPTLKVMGTFIANVDVNNDPTAKAITEKTGYTVEYSMTSQDNPLQRLNLELASGADYDIVRMGPDEFRALVGQNAFLPLDDLLAKYGQEMKSVISAETWELTTYDGKIYGVPMMNERANIESTILMRKDILDALGLEVPTTKEEFASVLRAVKKAYPDMIPYSVMSSGNVNGIYSETLLSAFDIYFEWNDVDGTLKHYVQMPEYKEYLAYLATLYSEGLIDKDIAINKKVNLDEKFTSGKVFAIPSNWYEASTQVPALYANVPSAEITYVLPLKDENGIAHIRANKYLNNVSVVLKNSKHPEDAVKFMNAKLTEPTFTYVTLGTEGETFTKEGDKYEPIMPIFSEVRNNAWWYLNGIREVEYADMWMARTRRNVELGKAFDAVNAESDSYAVYSPVANMPTPASLSKYRASLNQLVVDNEIIFVTGVKPISSYDSFLSTWENQGGAEVSKDVNAWFSK